MESTESLDSVLSPASGIRKGPHAERSPQRVSTFRGAGGYCNDTL